VSVVGWRSLRSQLVWVPTPVPFPGRRDGNRISTSELAVCAPCGRQLLAPDPAHDDMDAQAGGLVRAYMMFNVRSAPRIRTRLWGVPETSRGESLCVCVGET
jgi:hypothetical protein